MPGIQELNVQIDAQGNVKIDVRGVSGAKCEDLTALLEQALGGKVIERVHKDAYYHEDVETVTADRISDAS